MGCLRQFDGGFWMLNIVSKAIGKFKLNKFVIDIENRIVKEYYEIDNVPQVMEYPLEEANITDLYGRTLNICKLLED